MTQPFVDNAASLEAAAEKGEGAKKAEFRRFVEEFGTHFATQEMLRLEGCYTFAFIEQGDSSALTGLG